MGSRLRRGPDPADALNHHAPSTLDDAAGPRVGPTGRELLGIERLERYARRLAALLTVTYRRRGSSGALKTLRDHTQALRHIYSLLTDDARRGEPVSPAAEWVLDNFH